MRAGLPSRALSAGAARRGCASPAARCSHLAKLLPHALGPDEECKTKVGMGAAAPEPAEPGAERGPSNESGRAGRVAIHVEAWRADTPLPACQLKKGPKVPRTRAEPVGLARREARSARLVRRPAVRTALAPRPTGHPMPLPVGAHPRTTRRGLRHCGPFMKHVHGSQVSDGWREFPFSLPRLVGVRSHKSGSAICYRPKGK